MPISVGGDLIVAIDGKEVVDTSDIGSIMEKHQPGDVVTMTVYRGRKKMMLKVTLGDAHEVNT